MLILLACHFLEGCFDVDHFLFICLFLVTLGLCTRVFSSDGEWDYSSLQRRIAIAVGFSWCGAQAPGMRASVVWAHRLSCSMACGIFPDQGSNL